MGKKAVYCAVPVVLLCCLIACTKTAQYIETVTPSDNPYLVQVDSFSADFTSYRVDSFVTSYAPYAFVGFHKDELFGSAYCEHYMRFDLPSVPEMNNSARFDSLELVLPLNHDYYGDTTSTLALQVHRLTAPISNELNQFYSNTRFAVAAENLGQLKSVVRPLGTDSLRLLLDPVLGKELFDLMKANGEILTDATRFKEYFKGIRLSVDSFNSNIVIGFRENMVMNLHYHEDDGNIERKTISFSREAAPYRFNYIRKNFTGSPIAALSSSKEINATATNNRFYLQEFSKLRTRISFPAIKEVLKSSEYVKIMNAQLEIKPLVTSYVKYPLPPAVHLYQQQSDQTLFGPLTHLDGSVQTGSLLIDQLYGKDTRYVYDVTSYLLQELQSDNYSSQKLVLAVAGGDSTLGRMTGSTTQASELRSRLIVSMLIYKTQ